MEGAGSVACFRSEAGHLWLIVQICHDQGEDIEVALRQAAASVWTQGLAVGSIAWSPMASFLPLPFQCDLCSC